MQIDYKISGDFLDILDRFGLTLVVSARPSYTLLLGARDGRLFTFAHRISKSMGLAVDSDTRLAIANKHAIALFSNAPGQARLYPAQPNHFDAFFVPRAVFLTGECEMHDMEFIQGSLIAVNTVFSCICRIDEKFSFTPIWKPWFISELRADDRCHLNGFCTDGSRMRYATALSISDAENGWRNQPDDRGVLIDAQDNSLFLDGLNMPHSPRLFKGELFLLNGGRGEVLRVDQQERRAVAIAQLPGFTHGLCFHEDVAFVGLSQNRVSRKQNPPQVARQSEELVAGVAAVRIDTGQVLGMIEFTSGVTEVYDVRPIPGIRVAGVQDPFSENKFTSIETPFGHFWTQQQAPSNSNQEEQDRSNSETAH